MRRGDADVGAAAQGAAQPAGSGPGRQASEGLALLRILDLRASERGREIERFGSTGARHLPAAQIPGAGVVGIVELEPGGGLGRHPAVVTQLFLVVAGEGWVTGADGVRVSVSAGDAVLWETGEEHESGTGTGLTAVVVEAPGLTAAGPSTPPTTATADGGGTATPGAPRH